VGASRFGVSTLRQSIERGHEAVLVDRDRDRLDAISDEIECGLIHGDGTLPSILREAQGDAADVLLMATNLEETNILGAAVGRSIGFERVVIQLIRPELRPICAELGFEDVVMPHETAARTVMDKLDDGAPIREDEERG
jgi:trk system potassium uptake protein TrkA